MKIQKKGISEESRFSKNKGLIFRTCISSNNMEVSMESILKGVE